MSSPTHNFQILVYDSTLNYSRWSTLSLTVAADNTVTGAFEYSGAVTLLTGKKVPDGPQDNYVLDGGDVSIRLSSYPTFGSQLPLAGVASIDQAMPFYIIGKLA